MRIEDGGDRWNVYFTNANGVEEKYMHPKVIRDCASEDANATREITKELLQSILVDDATADVLVHGIMAKMGMT
jgi:hypothetical protein